MGILQRNSALSPAQANAALASQLYQVNLSLEDTMATQNEDDAITVALLVAKALMAAGADYFVDGSVASSMHGDPRSTNDIDFVIDIPLGKVGELCAALGESFEVDEAMVACGLGLADR